MPGFQSAVRMTTMFNLRRRSQAKPSLAPRHVGKRSSPQPGGATRPQDGGGVGSLGRRRGEWRAWSPSSHSSGPLQSRQLGLSACALPSPTFFEDGVLGTAGHALPCLPHCPFHSKFIGLPCPWAAGSERDGGQCGCVWELNLSEGERKERRGVGGSPSAPSSAPSLQAPPHQLRTPSGRLRL